MSRPFSYNDENFTVIGNLLFFHMKITKEIKQYDNIAEIPPEIYKRMLNKGCVLMCTTALDEVFNKLLGYCRQLPNWLLYSQRHLRS